MATETDMRLRSWLDSNQRDREQMCRAILALDRRYTEVRPRHPLGGRDGGRDIEAVFAANRVAYGAVGFTNGVNDSAAQKNQIRKKFAGDLKLALAADPGLKVFVFFTNLHLTMGEQDSLKRSAKKVGIEHCDVLDRERLRIELDSPSGYFIRFQHLAIPLSEAEQASFLSRYGTQIQEVVTTGFQKVEKTLNRLLFLTEANDVLHRLSFRFVLNKPYPASEIGHFRAFVFLSLRAITYDIFAIWFGTADRSDRYSGNFAEGQFKRPPGIANGQSSAQWERHLKISEDGEESGDEDEGSDEADTAERERYKQVGSGNSIGMDPVPSVVAHYSHDEGMIRFRSRLQLRDLDDCSFLPIMNKSLAEKLHSFQVFANGYKLADFGPDDLEVESSPRAGTDLPGNFTPEELADPWVKIRPSSMSSAFRLRFAETTPRRTIPHDEATDSPAPGSKLET